MHLSRTHLLVLALAASIAIFVVDLAIPIVDAVWILYVVPLLIVSSQDALILLSTAIFSSILIAFGHLFTPYVSETLDVINRTMGVVVELVMAVFLIYSKRINRELYEQTTRLKQEIIERKATERKLFESRRSLVENLEKERELERQLRQSQRVEALGTLTGGVAHDFNNILAAMIGFTELARDHLSDDGRAHHYLDRVLQAGIRARDLVRQMLTFSRKTEEEKKPLELSSVVKETIRLLRASIPTTISIRTRIESDSSMILGNPVQIQQVLMNLATNAAYAMREKGGALDISLSDFAAPSDGSPHGMTPGSYIELAVSDTGSGIPPDIVDKVFDPFFTTKRPGEGTGLGLSVVMGIVKQSRGYITVESEPGRGTSFNVYFPKAEEALKTEQAGEYEGIPGGHERILFVDDEKTMVEMGEGLLSQLGYKVTAKTNGKEALALFRRDPSCFDLVISDQTMPDMTGVDLATRMLVIRPDISIILATGFSHLVDAESAKALGIKAFIMKPLMKSEMAKIIRQVLDQR